MKKFWISIIEVVAITAFALSCIPNKKLSYFNANLETTSTSELKPSKENIIKPNDELYISISSFDDPNLSFVSESQSIYNSGFSTELSVSLVSYTVQTDGTIQLPVVGKTALSGLTLDEAKAKLEGSLKDYLNQPIIKIKFGFKKFTVLGEVNQPGYYTYTKDRINILEALGTAGDMTLHGDRRNILLIRETENKIEKQRIDLTSDIIFSSDYYYLKPDDIIYVKPRSSVTWSSISTPISLIFSTITTTILILNYVSQ